MNKRLLSILIAAIFLSSIVLAAAPVKATKIPDYEPVHLNDPRAGTYEMPTLDPSSDMMTSDEMAQLQSAPAVGTVVWDYYLRVLTGNPYMTLKATVGKAEVWLAQNLLFPPADWRNSDPRLTPPDNLLEYMAQEFDTNIYPTDIAHFTAPADRDGTNTIFEQLGWPSYRWAWINAVDDPQRVIIKVLNYRDQNWNDPTYPYYVAGFFQPTYTLYYNRNMVHLDSWDWQNRVGPNVSRPFVYDSTLAHEYQHNIHFDAVPGDADYMNEGCAMYAEVLCGYGVSWNHVNSFLYTPDNSLVKWGDQGDINILADYGQALLWTIYLEDNYSPADQSFVTHYMEAGIPADFGINTALTYFGYPKTFDNLYYEWNLANYLHSFKKAPYAYKSIDLNPATNPNVIPMNIHAMSGKIPKKERSFSFYGSDFGSTITILGYDTYVVDLAPYSSDYILFTDGMEDTRVLSFEGGAASEVPYGWQIVGGEWYSGTGVDLLNTLLAGTVHVGTSDTTLEITTYWDIEDYWDFGCVQVSTDDGVTWTSLENAYTTTLHDPGAYFEIVKNLPGLTSWTGSYETMTFDLSAYAGQDVMLGFRYMTDWGTTYEGWYISSVKVSGDDIPLTSFQKMPSYPSYFTVTLAYIDPIANIVSNIETVDISHPDETGQATISAHGKQVLVIVSNPSDPTLFAYGVADYKITLSKP